MEAAAQVTTRILPCPETPAVIVGLAPARSGAPPWSPDAGSTARLAEFVGCAPSDLGRHFGLANLCSSWRGTDQPTWEALKAAGRRACGHGDRPGPEEFAFVRGFRYVLAGVEVVRALGAWVRPRDPEHQTIGYGVPRGVWFVCRGGVEVAAIPHPSGRNRDYNDKNLRGKVELFLRSCAWRGRVPADELWRGKMI